MKSVKGISGLMGVVAARPMVSGSASSCSLSDGSDLKQMPGGVLERYKYLRGEVGGACEIDFVEGD